jgi:alanyl-tRNA synthetase
MQTANDIRTAFLDYFVTNGHAIVLSSPLVPRDARSDVLGAPAGGRMALADSALRFRWRPRFFR